MHMSKNATVLLLVALLALAAAPAFGAADSAEPVEKIRTDRHPKPADWKAPDQHDAMLWAKDKRPFIKEVRKEAPALRQQRLREMGLGVKDVNRSYFWLESEYVNTYGDEYQPVRFMHAKHAAVLEGNCALCHHYSSAEKDALETLACRSCHQESFKPEMPGRIGLKAAYHLQCMGCHENMKQGPVSCVGCHRENPVDHKELVQLPENPTPQQVTQECLRCHENAGQDMLSSAHWLWRGPSPYTVGQQKEVMSGKGSDTLNNF